MATRRTKGEIDPSKLTLVRTDLAWHQGDVLHRVTRLNPDRDKKKVEESLHKYRNCKKLFSCVILYLPSGCKVNSGASGHLNCNNSSKLNI